MKFFVFENHGQSCQVPSNEAQWYYKQLAARDEEFADAEICLEKARA